VSDTFSFSESSQNSTNTGSMYFNGYALYTLNSAVASGDNLLTAQGMNALKKGDNFASLCGSHYMTSLPAGMLVTGRLSYNSQSSVTTKTIADTLSLSWVLSSLSTAMSKSLSSSDSSVSLDFELEVEGGGSWGSALLTDMAPIQTYLPSCATGTTQGIQDCDTFVSGANGAVSRAIAGFSSSIPTLADYTTLAIFPNGVQGVTLPAMVPALAYSALDFLKKYAPQMKQTMAVLNQVSALANRVDLYLTPAIANPSANPKELLDLSQYVSGKLSSTYGTARTALFDDLSACLGSTSTTVDTDCAGVVKDAAFATAYDYFGSSGPKGGNWLAQQNAIALQWAATATDNSQGDFWSGSVPQDVLYVDHLPPFTNTRGSVLANQSALVSFADQVWYNNGCGSSWETCPYSDVLPYLFVMPMANNTDLSQIYSSVNSAWLLPWFYEAPAVWTTSQSCQPTVLNPCTLGINVNFSQPLNPIFIAVQGIPGFFTP